MRAFQMTMCTLALLAAIGPTSAGTGASLPAMAKGEVVAVMPDGRMARSTITDAAMMDELNKIAKPIPWCMMFMLGQDGNVYMIDTSAHAPMVECEEMVP